MRVFRQFKGLHVNFQRSPHFLAVSFGSKSKEPFEDGPDSSGNLKNPQGFMTENEEMDPVAFEEELQKIKSMENYQDFSNIVVETDEQKLSSRLFDVSTPDEVLKVYEDLLSTKAPVTNEEKAKGTGSLSYHELCLFFYFINYYEGPVTHQRLLDRLIASLFFHLEEAIQEFCESFVWALGNSIRKGVITLDQNAKTEVASGIKKALDQEPCQVKSLSALLHSVQTVYNEPLDKEISGPLVAHICQKAIRFAKDDRMNFEIFDVLNILMSLLQAPGEAQKHPEFLSAMAEKIKKNIEEVNQESIAKIIYAFVDSGYKEESFLETLHEILESYCDEVEMEDLCSVFLCYAQLYKGDNGKVSKLTKAILKSLHQLNISDYMNLWLGLARFSPRKQEDVLPMVRGLKKVITKPSFWTIKDMESFELVNIVLAMSSLKIDDQEFLHFILTYLVPFLSRLQPGELCPLASSFLIYSNQFEGITHHFEK